MYELKFEFKPISWSIKILLFSLLILQIACNDKSKKHLFILSGQSNMERLNPNKSFIPTLKQVFDEEQIIVVKYSKGGTPIKRWYRNWVDENGNSSDTTAYLYNQLISVVIDSIDSQDISTVTFLWMQGERDAGAGYGKVYKRSLIGLYNQLSEDLHRSDINFVIGRLSDFDLQNASYPHWTLIRKAQMRVANSDSRFDWVNTDDLNDGINENGETIRNDLHYSKKGYEIFGRRLANKAIELIKKNKKSSD